jgi:hypothetical protein
MSLSAVDVLNSGDRPRDSYLIPIHRVDLEGINTDTRFFFALSNMINTMMEPDAGLSFSVTWRGT